MKVIGLLFHLYLGFYFGVSLSQCNVNGNQEGCYTFNGTLGECIQIQNCPSLFSISKENPPSEVTSLVLILSSCGADGESKVCCEKDEDIVFGDETPLPVSKFLGSTPSKHNDRCSTVEGRSGKCIPTKQCPPLFKKLKDGPFTPEKRDYFRKAGCGFEGNDPMVCCPDEPIERPTTDNIPSGPITSTLLPGTDMCGPMGSNKIVGGQVADIAEFPWMALLDYGNKNGSQFNCGGSLINKRYVLTAAHCIKPSLVSVRLGEFDIRTTKDCDFCTDAVDIEVAETIVPDNYYANTHDIALVRLAREVTYTDFIRPICIHNTTEQLSKTYEDTDMIVSGWGVTENGTSSDVLRKIKVPIKKITDCSRLYSAKMEFLPGLLCAGGESGQDSCGGDSGGPLMVSHLINVYIAGVVSFGSGRCGLENWPGVYTKVSYYVPWIVSKLKP